VTVICDPDPATAGVLGEAVGHAVLTVDLDELHRHLDARPDEDTVVVGPGVDLAAALRLAGTMRVLRPVLGVVLVRPSVDAPLLGEAIRAGVREVVDTRDLGGVTAALHRSHALSAALAAHLPAPEKPPAVAPCGRVVTVFSAKGGCGKTTLATNLAAALADRGRREVCLVDLDLAFGDVAIALQLFPARTIADAVPLGPGLDHTALASLLTPHSPGLTTLVAPVDPGSGENVPTPLVTRILEILRSHFDYVVVDTPPAFDDHVLTAFDLSDVVALLATLDIPAIKNLKLTLDTMSLLNYPQDRWRVVLNRADSRVGLATGEVEKTLRTPIRLEIPSSRDVPASVNRGVPIVLDDPRHPVSLAIRSFAERQVAGPMTLHALDHVMNPRGATTQGRPDRRERRNPLRRRTWT
jgi:pilus assembly protein CpaE